MARGLSSAEVAQRLAAGQVNRVRRSAVAEYRDIVVRNVVTLFNALVVPAAIALLSLGDIRGGLAVSGMAITNTLLGLIQEIRAKRHLDQLALLSQTRARVFRDDREIEIAADDVVLGDLLAVRGGEPIVADGPVEAAEFLEVDESLLTGESDPVPRTVGQPLLSGSFCVAGQGTYRATQVGPEAFAQKTAGEAKAYQYTASPMQQHINQLLRWLSVIAVLLCVSYLVLLRNEVDETELVQMIAATITSMVPQGLVLMATLAFLLGAVRMSKRGAVVQRLSAVEAMASVDVLCMDKTGTLTTNQLQVDRVIPLRSELATEEMEKRVRVFASATIDKENKTIQALQAKLGPCAVELVDQIPFKSQLRFSAVRARHEGKEWVLALGACEALGERLEPGFDGWRKVWEALLPSGLRVLMLVESEHLTAFNGSLDGFPLRPVALIALRDELRPEAGQVLRDLAQQGIAFKIISGDNPATVHATTAPLEIPLAHAPVVSGDELAKSEDPVRLIQETSVFGRVAPRQKVQIVETLQQQGANVAMIGDGVNDVLPIKKADLGIAMGEGSQASKTVAGLVLENNNFQLLPQTLEEGRTIVRNLRRAAKLFLLKNVYALLLIIGGVLLLRKPFPFLPQQVTLLNFLTIGLPALLITLTREPSALPRKRGFLSEVGGFALRTGIVMAVAGLVLLVWSGRVWSEEKDQRTIVLTGLILLGATALWRVLKDGEERPLASDAKLRWLALGVVPVYLLVMYTPWPADFFQLTALDLRQWGMVAVVVVPALLLCEVSDLAFHFFVSTRVKRRSTSGPRSRPSGPAL